MNNCSCENYLPCWYSSFLFLLSLQLIEKHGYEAERHLFRCLFSFIDFASDSKSNGKDFLQVSCREMQLVLSKTNTSGTCTMCSS